MKQLFTAFLVETMSAKPGLTGAKYVEAAKKWMLRSNDIVADIRAGLNAVESFGLRPTNEITELFGEFLKVEVTGWLDELSTGSFEIAKNDRLQMAVVKLVGGRSADVAQKEVARVMQTLFGAATVWVKSATVVDEKLRATMRKEMKDKYLVFTVDGHLLGGMKLVSEGKAVDGSWLARINKLEQLVG